MIIACRDVDKGTRAIDEEILRPGCGEYTVPNAKALITVAPLDLDRLESIQSFAYAVEEEERIDFLILNASIMAMRDLERTSAGFEKQIGINYFGGFYLMSLLRRKLLAQDFDTRVVTLSSSVFPFPTSYDCWEDMHFNTSDYSATVAYGRSKLANVLFAKELADQTWNTRLTSVSVDPGVVVTTVMQHLSMIFKSIIHCSADKTIPQSAATIVFACLESSLTEEWYGGSLLVDCAVGKSCASGRDAAGKGRKRLWVQTEQLLNEALERQGLARVVSVDL